MENGNISTRRRFLDTADGVVHYRVSGDGEPLLLLHQSPRSSESSFSEVVPILARERRVIAMDSPGYGDSDKPSRSFSIGDFAKTAILLLDDQRITKASILGHHTGAFIAIEMAAAYPERVDKLILSFPVPILDDEQRRIAYQSIIAGYSRYEAKADGSHLVPIWRSFYERSGVEPPLELVSRLFLDGLKASAKGDLGRFAFRGLIKYRMEERLPLIQCPTLIVWGMEDLKFTEQRYGLDASQNRHKVGALIPRSKTVEFEGPNSTGQFINRMPHEFAQVVDDFLRNPGV